MTSATVELIGRVSLGVYALLLAGGGLMGYLKVGSKTSLLAGLLSAIFALLALMISFGLPALGFSVGLLVAVLMMATFLARFANRRKFFPTGLLCLLSFLMIGLLFKLISK